VPEYLYVAARRVLLDALEALGDQRDAVVLVGAQAIHLHTGAASDFVAQYYTTDADLVFSPQVLADSPLLEDLMCSAGFERDPMRLGTWTALSTHPASGVPIRVSVDLLVPEAVGGDGRRHAEIPPHGSDVARTARGLEAALVDRSPRVLESLEPRDSRNFEVLVAGPAALLIAKLHKINERADEAGRSSDKDALDVLRLLRASDLGALAEVLVRLEADRLAAEVTREAMTFAGDLFGTASSTGSVMAARAAFPEDQATIAASAAALFAVLDGAITSARRA
jgi:hypothetical protein